jgi:5-methylcytosine-specific restriction endonuclease McrA
VFTSTTNTDTSTGEVVTSRRGLFSIQIDHRGKQISDNLTSRAQLRRGRRSRNLRYRQPRFNNRTRPQGWLAPSLQHRVDGTVNILAKLRRWFPATAIHQELVRFDMQLIGNPEITGVEYQRGTLFATEIREYLLEKYHRTCVYCDAKNTIFNIDHVRPQSKGGTNAVTNLVLACIPCNQAKGARRVEDFVTDPKRLARVLASTRRPLRDAAAVNSTRWALKLALEQTGLPVFTGTGGQTKFNRTRLGLPKTHCVDALVVGDVDAVTGHAQIEQIMKQVGRGSYARTRSDKYGFPRLKLTRVKRHFGFATGDIVRAVIPAGKKAGTHFGRVAVRSSGSFNIGTGAGVVSGLHHKHFTLIQHGNGWSHTHALTNR